MRIIHTSRLATIVATTLIVMLVAVASLWNTAHAANVGTVRITPRIASILCPPASGWVAVDAVITGTLTPADIAAGGFEIRLVDSDLFDDDTLDKVFGTLPGGAKAGARFRVACTFYVRCSGECYIEGPWGSSYEVGEGPEAELAVEVGDNTNHGSAVVECSRTGAPATGGFAPTPPAPVPAEVQLVPPIPAFTQWGLIALGVLLSAALVVLIARRYGIRGSQA